VGVWVPGEYYELLDGSLRGAAATLEQAGSPLSLYK